MSVPTTTNILPQTDHRSRKEWRRDCRMLMAGFSDEQKKRYTVAIGTELQNLIVKSNVKTLAVYWPIHDEPDLLPLWQGLQENGLQLALPRVIAKGEALQFAPWRTHDRLVINEWGIAELGRDVPALTLQSIEMVVMPCVGYWRTGYRLGYGGGFYDRTLGHWRSLPMLEDTNDTNGTNGTKRIRIAVGLAYAQCALPESVGLLSTDQQCDLIITPEGSFYSIAEGVSIIRE
jgi:5-formyltetrahydrofolate cyclo-ligase